MRRGGVLRTAPPCAPPVWTSETSSGVTQDMTTPTTPNHTQPHPPHTPHPPHSPCSLQEGGSPWFFFMSYFRVHTPLFTQRHNRGRSAGGAFGDNVEELDDSVGPY